MSQYAFFLKKKIIARNTRILFDKNSKNVHNGFELTNVFNIEYKISYFNTILFSLFRILQIKKYKYISRPIIFMLNTIGISLVEENYNYNFNIDFLKPSNKKIKFYYGGWHSEKYFISIKKEILKEFIFNIKNENPYFNSFQKKILELNSVSIHVRKGDYLEGVNSSTFGSVCTKEYFLKAIGKINSLVSNPYFFVFTNDQKWVSENIANNNLIRNNLIIVNINSGVNSWKDMYLISKCKHHINSNSTFSWWGSWLNSFKDKIIITPKYFINNNLFEDIYPETWIKISDY